MDERADAPPEQADDHAPERPGTLPDALNAPSETGPLPEDDSLAARGSARSQRPTSTLFTEYMTSQWAPPVSLAVEPAAAAPYTAERRRRLGERFPGCRLVVPAGTLVRRSNDTDHRFRPHSAFAHLTGLGTEQEPDAVLVLHPEPAGTSGGHRAVLYLRPLAPRDSEEFYSDARHGEFWVGPRPTLEDIATITGVETAHRDELEAALLDGLGGGVAALLVVPDADAGVEAMVGAVRTATGTAGAEGFSDALLAEALSELRLVKDAHEIGELRRAVDATVEGFAAIVRALPRATGHPRGERVVETVFDAHARLEGNAVGYGTIAASGDHATTLHWTRNDGRVRDGDLLLVDAGVEVDSLYTADVTRTIPVTGAFSTVQRRVYQAVLDAADAAFAVAVPGAAFSEMHAAAMRVIAERLASWDLLPVSAEESLAAPQQWHRRWMLHGTGHHLGLDVHDCAQARREAYLGGVLEPGMVFTIEPGLYFKRDDLSVPPEYRGIGVRIEDDVLVTETGTVNLSAALPRRPDEVEAWISALRPRPS